MGTAEQNMEWVTTPTARKKKKRQELRVAVLKNNTLQRHQSEEAASYSNKNKSVAGSTVAPNWARDTDVRLRALILSEKAYCDSRAGAESRVMALIQRPHKEYHDSTKEETGVTVNSSIDISGGYVSAKEFRNGYDAKHNSVASEAMFQTRQKIIKSNYSFNEHRVVSGHEVTLVLRGKVESNNNGDTLTGPVRVGHTRIKTCAEIRAENNSTVDSTSSCSALKKASRVSDCLPQKLSCKNTEAKYNLLSASHGNKFRMPVSNPDEKDRLQKTEETTPDSKFTPRKSQLKRKNRDAASGPAPKRSRSIRIAFNSLEYSEVSGPRCGPEIPLEMDYVLNYFKSINI